MASAINLNRLQRELAVALEADQRYQRENDAKFRAVHQKVASYEEFRDIVKASHLNPLENKDIVGGPTKQPWNTVATVGETGTKTGESKVQELVKCPSNSQEFIREWRRCMNISAEQYRLLVSLPADQVFSMVTVEASIFGRILTVLNEHFDIKDIDSVIAVLSALTKMPRFSLLMDFLSAKEKESVSELISNITARTDKPTPDFILELQKVYQLSPLSPAI